MSRSRRWVVFLLLCLLALPARQAMAEDAASDACVRDLYGDFMAWVQIQQERRELTGFNPNTATGEEQANDMKMLLEGMLVTIDMSRIGMCPDRLAFQAKNLMSEARKFNSTLERAMDIARRVKAGKVIPRHELESTDRDMQHFMGSWQETISNFDKELESQYSTVGRGE